MATEGRKHGLKYGSGGWRRTRETGFTAQSSSSSLWGGKLQKTARPRSCFYVTGTSDWKLPICCSFASVFSHQQLKRAHKELCWCRTNTPLRICQLSPGRRTEATASAPNHPNIKGNPGLSRSSFLRASSTNTERSSSFLSVPLKSRQWLTIPHSYSDHLFLMAISREKLLQLQGNWHLAGTVHKLCLNMICP